MDNDRYAILKMLYRFTDFPNTHHDLRFGQILSVTGILKTAPTKVFTIPSLLTRDPFYDSDEQIVKRMKETLKGKYKLTPYDGGKEDLYTMEKFKKMCDFGAVMNSDGFGFYATEKEESDILIKPTDITMDGGFVDFRVDEKLTHVAWYNN